MCGTRPRPTATECSRSLARGQGSSGGPCSQVVRFIDAYLYGRASGPIFTSRASDDRWGYQLAYEQLGRLCRDAGLPAGVTPHSLRHSYATESLRLGAALQDVQDALGHADPRTTRRYDRSRHNLDRSPNYLLASALTDDGVTA